MKSSTALALAVVAMISIASTNGRTLPNSAGVQHVGPYYLHDIQKSEKCPCTITYELAPVCGSDNKTYPNENKLKCEACEKASGLTKKSDGACPES